MLFASDVPYVLGLVGNYYQLVGQTYVRRIIEGQPVREARRLMVHCAFHGGNVGPQVSAMLLLGNLILVNKVSFVTGQPR